MDTVARVSLRGALEARTAGGARARAELSADDDLTARFAFAHLEESLCHGQDLWLSIGAASKFNTSFPISRKGDY